MTKKETTNFNIINEDPEFVISIVYTSGTSGKPKGVMLSNKNLYNQIYSLFNNSIRKAYSFQYHLSYLPISHVYERTFSYSIILFGGTLNIWSKDLSYFSKDVFNSKDFIMGGVPKVFSRMYTNIMTEIDNLSPIKRRIIKKIISLRKCNKNGCLGNFLDNVFNVSRKIKEKVNPNLQIILNCGGKLPPDVANELCTLLNINYCQSYGLTETAGGVFGTNEGDFNFESVGGPIAANTKYKVRTWEIYKATDTLPKGELLVKSDSIFKGYFLEKECTQNSFTNDGYFITGDVVQINKNGFITFLDRSKGLVKLFQGEYIETNLLNNLYSQISFINNCVIYGDDLIDEDNVLEQCGVIEKNYVDKLIDENINNNIFVDYVKEKMLEVYKETNLNRYNINNNIYLTSKTWGTNNYLTPTFKVKRFHVFKTYAFFIDGFKEIYKNKLKGNTRSSTISDKVVAVKDTKNCKETLTKSENNDLHKSKPKHPEKNLEKKEEITENKKVKLRATNVTQEKEQNN
ncbi:acyl-CoA synthetase, putative [Plasmodium gaboni]|uniref:Acyl-CoA synthetase, putative n=1 Tax=Plasmodium gaboni TaxID=647221 RepID=A0ABY0L066_9APIC|nr:acyl-CoA synthetase, putative [Plasmodium gaboni]